MGSKSGRKRRQRERAQRQKAGKKGSPKSPSKPKASAGVQGSRDEVLAVATEVPQRLDQTVVAVRSEKVQASGASTAAGTTAAPSGQTQASVAKPQLKAPDPIPGPAWSKPTSYIEESPALASPQVSPEAAPMPAPVPAASAQERTRRWRLVLFMLAVCAPCIITFLVIARSA